MTTQKAQNVLVTGASRGLGRQMALYLADQGFRVFGTVRSAQAAETLARETAGTVTPSRLDVTDPEQVATATRRLATEVGDEGLAGLVNNARTVHFGPIEQMPIEAVDAQLRANILGPVTMIRETLPLLRRGQGRIVNISSINALLPSAHAAIYSASKAALEMLSAALRHELRKWDIEVIVIRPAAFDTDVRARRIDAWRSDREHLADDARELYADDVELQSRFISALDGIAGDPVEVAEAVHQALTTQTPQAIYSVGPQMDTLLQVARLPDAERDAALGEMVTQLTGTAGR